MAPVVQARSRTIPAPANQVWERLVAISRWPDWHPLYTQMTAPTHPVQLGTRFRYSNNGTRITGEVVDLVPNSSFGFVGKAWGVTARNQWRLTPIDSQRTEVSVREEMLGLLPWLLRGPFNRGLAEGLERWLESLERSLSSQI
ncbi:MAG: SRPBCC family protein [Planctomycetota bacterium]|nr:SRPBCC family protein [Planctomycetota bacterium]